MRSFRGLVWSTLGFVVCWMVLAYAWANVSYFLLAPASRPAELSRSDPAYGMNLGIVMVSTIWALLLHLATLVVLNPEATAARDRLARGAVAAVAGFALILVLMAVVSRLEVLGYGLGLLLLVVVFSSTIAAGTWLSYKASSSGHP